jgi:tetratricopeptide (TPR) repeat protein
MKRYSLLVVLLGICMSAFGQGGKERKVAKLIDQGKYEKGLRRANDAILKNESAEAYHLRGYYFSLINETRLALEDYDKSISIKPNYAQAYFDRAHSYFINGQSGKAVTDYSSVISLAPDFIEAYLNRGTVKLEQGNTRGACSDWRTAASLGLEFANEIIAINCEGY